MTTIARTAGSSGGRGRVAARAVAALALAAALAPGARADLGGRGVLTYQDQDAGPYASRGLLQNYELRLDRRVSDPVLYRLFLRYQDERGSTTTLGQRVGTKARLLEPAAEVLLSPGAAQLLAGYDVTLQDLSVGGGPYASRVLQRLHGALSLRPPDLPAVSVRAERRGTRDDLAAVDTTEDVVEGGVDWTWRALRLSPFARMNRFEDARAAFRRNTVDVGAGVELQTPFSRGRGSATASYRVTFTRMDESAAGRAVAAPLEIRPARGLHSVDETPFDASDHPMSSVPGLVDDATGATGVTLGPTAPAFQNVGVDMGRIVEIDELRLEVRDAAGHTLPAAAGVSFRVYASADAIAWALVDGAPQAAFSAPFSAWIVGFAPRTARYFKLVTFGVNDVETVVVELRAFTHGSFEAGEQRRTDALLHAATASVSYRPASTVGITWNALANSFRQSPGDGRELSSLDWSQSLSTAWDPWKVAGVTLRYDKRRATATGGFVSDDDLGGVTLRFTPLERLQTAVGGTRELMRNSGQGGAATSTRTDTASLHQFAQLLPALDASLDVAYGRQTRLSDGATSDRRGLGATVRAGLTPALLVSLVGSLQDQTSLDPAFPSALDERAWVEAAYRPSPQLSLGGRAGYAVGQLGRGTLQQVRLQWNPFPGGALQIGTAYDQDYDFAVGQKLRRVALYPRWAINSRAAFEVSLLLMRREAQEAITRTGSLFATLTFNL